MRQPERRLHEWWSRVPAVVPRTIAPVERVARTPSPQDHRELRRGSGSMRERLRQTTPRGLAKPRQQPRSPPYDDRNLRICWLPPSDAPCLGVRRAEQCPTRDSSGLAGGNLPEQPDHGAVQQPNVTPPDIDRV